MRMLLYEFLSLSCRREGEVRGGEKAREEFGFLYLVGSRSGSDRLRLIARTDEPC